MGATANLLLQIMTKADLASLKAGLDMVTAFGARVTEVIGKVDAFGDAHARLSLDIAEAIAKTKGLISAQDAYEAANKLSSANIKAKSEQLQGLLYKASEYAQATGQDIPAALDQMTAAVIAGSSRGLRPFGVELAEGTSRLEASQIALNKFAAEASSATVQIDSLTNGLDAIGNNLADAAMRLVEMSEFSKLLITPLLGINDALTEFNRLMELAPDVTTKWMFSLRGLGAEMANVFVGLVSKTLVPLEGVIEVVGYPLIALAEWVGMAEANPVSLLRTAIEKAQEKLGEIAGESAAGMMGEIGSRNVKGRDYSGMTSSSAVGGAWSNTRDLATINLAEYGGKKRGGGGRSGGAGGPATTAGDLEARQDGVGAAVDQRMADMRAQMDYSAEDIESLTGIPNAPPYDPNAANASIIAMDEWIEARSRQKDAELSFAESFGQTWSSSLRGVSAGAMAATGAQNLLRGAVSAAANAMVGSSKLTVKSVAEMVKGIALAIGIEATIKGAMELAEAIRTGVSSWGMSPEVELHLAAAAQYGVTAGIAFAIAGGSSAIGGKSTGQISRSVTGTTTGQGQYGSPGYSSLDNRQNTTVIVKLEGDANGIFRVVDDENNRRGRNGERMIASEAA